MQRLLETKPIRDVLHLADKKIALNDLFSAYNYQGVVVEVGSHEFAHVNVFEGTLIYFPGVTLKQLKST